MRLIVLILMAVSLAACEEVVSERPGTFVYQGETFQTVTREYSRNGKTYERRTIYARTRPVSCSATDDRDCLLAIRTDWFDVR